MNKKRGAKGAKGAKVEKCLFYGIFRLSIIRGKSNIKGAKLTARSFAPFAPFMPLLWISQMRAQKRRKYGKVTYRK